jgi:hypothetical protein
MERVGRSEKNVGGNEMKKRNGIKSIEEFQGYDALVAMCEGR